MEKELILQALENAIKMINHIGCVQNCDGKGTTMGGEQCQWCYEKEQISKALQQSKEQQREDIRNLIGYENKDGSVNSSPKLKAFLKEQPKSNLSAELKVKYIKDLWSAKTADDISLILDFLLTDFANQQHSSVSDEEKNTYAAESLRGFCKYVMHEDSDLHKDAEEWIEDKLQTPTKGVDEG